MNTHTTSMKPKAPLTWWRASLAGLLYGALLVLLVLSVPGLMFYLVMLHPTAGIGAVAFLIGVAPLTIYVVSRSIAKALVTVACALVGMIGSIIPPISTVMHITSSWTTFIVYKGDLDRQAQTLSADNEVAKLTVDDMMLMSRGYAYKAGGEPTRDDAQWAAKLGISCVLVTHLYGHYYAWYSTECEEDKP